MELKEINPDKVVHGSHIWCYKIGCFYCDYNGAKDADGYFGECTKEEVVIGDKCKSYEEEIIRPRGAFPDNEEGWRQYKKQFKKTYKFEDD